MYDKQSLGLLEEARIQGIVNSVIAPASNIGSSNPTKGPTARSLFYEAGKRVPGKYGQFLFYALGSNENNFIDAYYRSENGEYNIKTSSVKSKNPTASFLVSETVKLQARASDSGILSGLFSRFEGDVIGGLSAPYYWKDFLYCKYYGTIPNNYMITLRRFPSPVLDNLSIPKNLDKNSDGYYKEGVMRPVAQAVTWFGGNSGNSLNDLISFSTGIQWETKPQSAIKTQEAYSKGFLQDGLVGDIKQGLSSLSDSASNIFNSGEIIATGAIVATDPSQTLTKASRVAALRDKAKNLGEGGGLMSEYIWTSVDVVKNTYVRGIGLPFDWKDIVVVFDYELTSVGEVNTKAAMLDILGNILSIGTNYGVFLTPDTRYNSAFPAIRFPGGDAGLELYYRNPVGWLSKYGDEITKIVEKASSSADEGNGTQGQAESQKVRQSVDKIAKDGSKSDSESSNFFKQFLGSDEVSRLFKFQQTASFIENYQMPLSFLTGAPIGEWHLTIGNPCNPIAMIGNLICSNVKIDFTEALGPDDFPTGVKATFTLQHGRDRERGEIESIFNRGDGRLYHSAQETSSNQQSFSSFADTAGNVLSYDSPGSLQDGFWNSQLDSIPDQLGPNN
jgi:hypothetical protein